MSTKMLNDFYFPTRIIIILFLGIFVFLVYYLQTENFYVLLNYKRLEIVEWQCERNHVAAYLPDNESER